MRNYFVAPRSGEKSYKNFQSTIKHGIPLARISEHLANDELEILAKEEIVYAWGNRKGTKSAWKKMQNDDLVLFYAKGKLVMSGEVYLKKHSPELALAMWPPDDKGNPWEYTFFLKNLRYISMPIKVFNKVAGYKLNDRVQNFRELQQWRVERVAQQYGSVELMRDTFVDEYSKEMPLATDKLYVNVPREVIPRVIENPKLVPKKAGAYSPIKSNKKPDYIARSQANSITGSRGEVIVLDREKKKLNDAGKPDLAEKVIRLSVDDDAFGYDILSYDVDGKERYIEVKTSVKDNKSMKFYVSSNEYNIGKSKDNYFIYFVENINSESPRITIIENPIDDSKFAIRPDGYIFEAER